MNRSIVALFALLAAAPAFAQDQASEKQAAETTASFSGPTKDVTYQVLWLIESEDENRLQYDGPAREGLATAGYGRMVVAGSATAMMTIGQRSTVTGTSRYGQLSVMTSMLNTTQDNELQVKVNLQSKNQFPMTIETTARAPLGRWFLVGSTDSRVGLPTHADEGKRAVAIMRVDDGVILLD